MESMDKDNAEDYYYFNKNFYESVLNDLPNNAQVFYAEYEGKIIVVLLLCSWLMVK